MLGAKRLGADKGRNRIFSGKRPIQGKVALDMLICHTWFFLPDKCGGGQGALRAGGSGGKCEILLLSWGTSWTRRNVFLQFKPEYICPCSAFFTYSFLPHIPPKAELREAFLKFTRGAFGHCPFSFCTPPPALKRHSGALFSGLI